MSSHILASMPETDVVNTSGGHQSQLVTGGGRLRVLFVSHTADQVGPTNSLLALIKYLDGRFDARVLLPGKGLFSESLAAAGVPCTSFATLRKGKIPAIARLIREHRIDLVYGNNTSRCSRNALVAAKLVRVPFICHVRSMGKARNRLQFGYFKFADATVAVSAACAASLPRLMRSRSVFVVHNGVIPHSPPHDRTAARTDLRKAFGFAPDAPVIVSVGNLSPRKGQTHAIKALSHLANEGIQATLMLVGSLDRHPAYVMECRALIRDLGLEERIRIVGFRSDVLPLLYGADLFLHTAVQDPHPRAVLEAMAVGLPIVAFAADGVTETVLPGQTGELVAVGDYAGLAAVSSRLLRDSRLRQEFGENGRARIAEEFSAAGTARRIGDIIEMVLRRRAPLHRP